MTLRLHYDGNFPLDFLHGTDATVTNSGEGTGACVIIGSFGAVKVQLGESIIRDGDKFWIAAPSAPPDDMFDGAW